MFFFLLALLTFLNRRALLLIANLTRLWTRLLRSNICGSKRTLLSQLSTSQIEPHRHGYRNSSNTSQQGGSPIDSHTIEHLPRKKREACTTQRSQERVRSNGRGSKHEIRIDEVVERLQEYGHDAEAGQEARKCRHDPVDGGIVACPAEPEKSCAEGDTAGDDFRQSPFRDWYTAVGCKLLVVAWLAKSDCQTLHTGQLSTRGVYQRKMKLTAKSSPVIMPKNGRPPTPALKPCTPWNTSGYAVKKRYKRP